MKCIRWGGPALPPGNFTTFTDRTQEMIDGSGRSAGFAETKAVPGDLTPVDQIINPDLYVNRGLGSYEESEPVRKGRAAQEEVNDGR